MSKWNLRYHVPVSTKAEARAFQPNRGPLSTLTKAKASDWLRAFGEEPRVEWTSVEIKSRIKEILDFLEEEDNQLPKGLSGMKKADLQRECTERGAHFTEHETRGGMMRKIRAKVEAEKGGTSESLMGFGKHADLTYEEVAENHPAYVKWARETVKEEGFATSAKLRKFVTWVNNKAAEKDKEAETRQKTESGRSSSAAASTGGRRVKRMAAMFSEKGADDMKAETPLMEENPSPTSKVEEHILGALGKLDSRLNSLETKQKQPEKHYDGTASAAWQNLSSDRGTEGM